MLLQRAWADRLGVAAVGLMAATMGATAPGPPAASGAGGVREGGARPLQVLSDPQTGGAPGETRGRNARSKNQCSMCPAIHTKSRSWLRSSSTREPSDPLLRVVFFVFSSFETSGPRGGGTGGLAPPAPRAALSRELFRSSVRRTRAPRARRHATEAPVEFSLVRAGRRAARGKRGPLLAGGLIEPSGRRVGGHPPAPPFDGKGRGSQVPSRPSRDATDPASARRSLGWFVCSLRACRPVVPRPFGLFFSR